MLHLAVIGIVCAVSAPSEGTALIEQKNDSNVFCRLCTENVSVSNYDIVVDVNPSGSSGEKITNSTNSSLLNEFNFNQYQSNKNSSCSVIESVPSEKTKKYCDFDFLRRKKRNFRSMRKKYDITPKTLRPPTDYRLVLCDAQKTICSNTMRPCKRKQKKLQRKTKKKKQLNGNKFGLNCCEKKIFFRLKSKSLRNKLKCKKCKECKRHLDRLKLDDELDLNKRIEKLVKEIALENQRKEKQTEPTDKTLEEKPTKQIESSSFFESIRKAFSDSKNYFKNVVKSTPVEHIHNEKNNPDKVTRISSYDILKTMRKVSRVRRSLPTNGYHLMGKHNGKRYFSHTYKNRFRKLEAGKGRERRKIKFRPFHLFNLHEKLQKEESTTGTDVITSTTGATTTTTTEEVSATVMDPASSEISTSEETYTTVTTERIVIQKRLPQHTLERPFLNENFNALDYSLMTEAVSPTEFPGLTVDRYLQIQHALRTYINNNKPQFLDVGLRKKRKRGCGKSVKPHRCWRTAPLLCLPYIKKGQDDQLKFLIKLLESMLGKPFPPRIDIFDKTKYKPNVIKPQCNDCEESESTTCTTPSNEICIPTCSTTCLPPYPLTHPPTCTPTCPPCRKTPTPNPSPLCCPTTPSPQTTEATTPVQTTERCSDSFSPSLTIPVMHDECRPTVNLRDFNQYLTGAKQLTTFPVEAGATPNPPSSTSGDNSASSYQTKSELSYHQPWGFQERHYISLPISIESVTEPSKDFRQSTVDDFTDSNEDLFLQRNKFKGQFAKLSDPELMGFQSLVNMPSTRKLHRRKGSFKTFKSRKNSGDTIDNYYRLPRVRPRHFDKISLEETFQYENQFNAPTERRLSNFEIPQKGFFRIRRKHFPNPGFAYNYDFDDPYFRAVEHVNDVLLGMSSRPETWKFGRRRLSGIKKRGTSRRRKREGDYYSPVEEFQSYNDYEDGPKFHEKQTGKLPTEENYDQTPPSFDLFFDELLKGMSESNETSASPPPGSEKTDLMTNETVTSLKTESSLLHSSENKTSIPDKTTGVQIGTTGSIKTEPLLSSEKEMTSVGESVRDLITDETIASSKTEPLLSSVSEKKKSSVQENTEDLTTGTTGHSKTETLVLSVSEKKTEKSTTSTTDLNVESGKQKTVDEGTKDSMPKGITESSKTEPLAQSESVKEAVEKSTTKSVEELKTDNKFPNENTNETKFSSGTISATTESDFGITKMEHTEITEKPCNCEDIEGEIDSPGNKTNEKALKNGKKTNFFQSKVKTTKKTDSEGLITESSKVNFRMDKGLETNFDLESAEEGQIPTTLKMALIAKGAKRTTSKPSPKAYSKVYPDSLANEWDINESMVMIKSTTGATFSEKTTHMITPRARVDLKLKILAVCESYLEVIKMIRAQNQTAGSNIDLQLARYCENIISQNFNSQSEKPRRQEGSDSQQSFGMTGVGKLDDNVADDEFYKRENIDLESMIELVTEAEAEKSSENLQNVDNVDAIGKGIKRRKRKKRRKLKRQRPAENNEDLTKRGVTKEQMQMIKLLRKRKKELLSWLLNRQDKTKLDGIQDNEYFDDQDGLDQIPDENSGTIKPRRKENIESKAYVNESEYPIYAKGYGYDKGGEVREVDVIWREVNEKTHEKKIFKNMSVLALLLTSTNIPHLNEDDLKLVGSKGFESEGMPQIRSKNNDKVGVADIAIKTQYDNFSITTTTLTSTTTPTTPTTTTPAATATTTDSYTTEKDKTKNKKTVANNSKTIVTKPDSKTFVGNPPGANKTHSNATRKSHRFGAAKDIFQEYSIEFLDYAVYILPIMFTILFFFCCLCCAVHLSRVWKKYKKKKKKKIPVSSEETTESTDNSESDSEKPRNKRKSLKSYLGSKKNKKFWKVLKRSESKPEEEENSSEKNKNLPEKKKNFLRFLKGKKEGDEDDEGEPSGSSPTPPSVKPPTSSGDEKQVNNRSDEQQKGKTEPSEAAERRELISLLEELKKIETEQVGEKKDVKSVQVQYMSQDNENPLFRHPDFGYPYEKNVFGLPKGYSFFNKQSPFGRTLPNAVDDSELYEDVNELTELLPCKCGYYSNDYDCCFRINKKDRCERFVKIFRDSGLNRNRTFVSRNCRENDTEKRRFVFNKYRSISTDESEDLLGVTHKNVGTKVKYMENSTPFPVRHTKNGDLVEEMENLKRQLNKKKNVRLKDDGVLCKL